jgi:hypothetical protein
MPALLELQRSMRRRLLAPTPQERAAPEDEVFAIYRNTVHSTLLNALRLSFPAVLRLVGPDFFEGAAREFIGSRPPLSACLNDYGGQFPDFLSQFAPAASLPYLGDVARLEWAVNCALHADDAVAVDPSRLASLDEAQLPLVRFRSHPALTLLQLEFPADLIWSAVLDENSEAMAAINLRTAAVQLLVERDANGVQVRRLSDWGWQFTRALAQGKPMHAALEGIEVPSGEALNALLAEHLTSGRFIDFRVVI